MPRSREENAARMRGQREAERHEASELHKPDVAAPSQQRVRSKRIAEVSALALALEEEEIVLAQEKVVLQSEERFACGKSHVRFNGSPNSHSTIRPRKAR